MTKSKITAGIGIAAGALIGTAAVTHGPVYEMPGTAPCTRRQATCAAWSSVTTAEAISASSEFANN